MRGIGAEDVGADVSWRERADGLRSAAAAGADKVRETADGYRLRHALSENADRVRREIIEHIDLAAVVEAAVDSSGIRNRKGEVKRWRVARAAVKPAATAGAVARGVGKEAFRQGFDIRRKARAGASRQDRNLTTAETTLRTIPRLNPAFYDSVRSVTTDRDDVPAETEVVSAVATAVYNAGLIFLQRTDDDAAEQSFTAAFEGRLVGDREAPDDMINALVAVEPATHEMLTALLSRLQVVLSSA